MNRVLLTLILIGIVWYQGFKPFIGELYQFKNRTAKKAGTAEQYIEKAIEHDPDNARYLMDAAQLHDRVGKFIEARDYIENVINHRNGDLTAWSVHFYKAIMQVRAQQFYEAKSTLEKSLWYYPKFQPAIELYEKVHGIIDAEEERRKR